jgi:uncharacterized damage-inducible protein DinB
MELIDHFRRQFAYNEWANREVLATLQDTAGSLEKPIQYLAHILSAELLWLNRLKRQSPTIAVWPHFDWEQCASQLGKVSSAWNQYLQSLGSAELLGTASYTNSKGEGWSSTVQDILSHVLLHSAYHRGQIASTMRANDQTPAYTDFIHAVRQKMIE